MGVGDLQKFEQSLNFAIFAKRAVQRVKGHIGLERCQLLRNIWLHINAGDAKTHRFQCLGAGLAGAQGDFTFGRPATHEYGDVLHV